jgi:hypothetical protein
LAVAAVGFAGFAAWDFWLGWWCFAALAAWWFAGLTVCGMGFWGFTLFVAVGFLATTPSISAPLLIS